MAHGDGLLIQIDIVTLLEGILLFGILSGFYYGGIKLLSCFYEISIENKKKRVIFCVLCASVSVLSRLLFPGVRQHIIEILCFILFSKLFLGVEVLPTLSSITLWKISGMLVEVFSNKIVFQGNSWFVKNELVFWMIQCLLNHLIVLAIFLGSKLLEQKKKISFKLHYERIFQNKKWNIFYGVSILIILSQTLEIIYYSKIYPVERLRLDIICVIIYYILINSNARLLEKQKILNEKIEILSHYNKNLVKTNDDVRAFKHDFNNIMQAIGGYIEFNDFDGLKIYYQDLITECNLVKNLTLINPIAINEQNLCNTILKKIESAQAKGISVEFVSFVDFQAIQIEYIEFYKVIENMLERATELAENSKNKEILVNCFYDEARKKNVIVLASSYEDEAKERIEEAIKLETWKKEIKEYIPKKGAIELYVSMEDKLLVQELNLMRENTILER